MLYGHRSSSTDVYLVGVLPWLLEYCYLSRHCYYCAVAIVIVTVTAVVAMVTVLL